MKFKDLRQYIVRDENPEISEEEMLRSYHYVSFFRRSDIMLEVPSPRGDGESLSGTYIQLIEDNEGKAIVIQLEGLPEDPFSVTVEGNFDETEVDVAVYQRIAG